MEYRQFQLWHIFTSIQVSRSQKKQRPYKLSFLCVKKWRSTNSYYGKYTIGPEVNNRLVQGPGPSISDAQPLKFVYLCPWPLNEDFSFSSCWPVIKELNKIQDISVLKWEKRRDMVKCNMCIMSKIVNILLKTYL